MKEQEDAEKKACAEQALEENELTPVEEFSTTLACYLANITARRFQKIYISGCTMHCPECHYPELQKKDYGAPLAPYLNDILDAYAEMTCHHNYRNIVALP